MVLYPYISTLILYKIKNLFIEKYNYNMIPLKDICIELHFHTNFKITQYAKKGKFGP